jgi:hypothetical protein
MTFSLFYRKSKNKELFETLEQSSIGITSLQNYLPIYNRFFSLNENNASSINLNSPYYIKKINNIQNDHIMDTTIYNEDKEVVNKKQVFIKYSPLLDPLKYIVGKYNNNDFTNLPSFNNSNNISEDSQMLDANNSAYIDSFMSYLTSNLLHKFNFFHGIDFYGAFIGYKKNFNYDIIDDMDAIHCNSYFYRNNNVLFDTPENFDSNFFDDSSRKYKNKIQIGNDNSDISISSFESDVLDNFSDKKRIVNDNNSENEIITFDDISKMEENPLINKEKEEDDGYSSSVSSNSSHTNHSNLEESCGEYETEEEDSDEEYDDDEKILLKIRKFPVQMICLEKCTETLDYLMTEGDLSEKEWVSALFQVVVILYTYQKCFNMTHNDLHTNNIMFVETDKKFLYYCVEGKHYKVPTYGKIFKIIDFGRSIYKYNNNIFCSDSFRPNGEAATQYNCEPYLNSKKPRLEPNMSFDLCRLACSIFDFFVDDLDEIDELLNTSAAFRIIHDWILDDKARNVLYKKNGEERYPDFKLYKMIARTVHNHVPKMHLQRKEFESFIVGRKKINKKSTIIHIDKMPVLV